MERQPDHRWTAEELVGPEWAAWYALTPEERWIESAKLWQEYIALGGSLDPDPDPQSPFYDEEQWLANSDGRRHDIVVGRLKE